MSSREIGSRTTDRDNEVGNIFAPAARVQRNAQSVSRATPPARPLVATRTPMASSRAPLVLIADGDAVSRDVREAQLRTAGLRVSVARTGFEAIVKASCQTPDVILLDNSLTGIEAADTLRMLRICPTTAHIPVVRLLRGRRLPQRMLSRLRRVAA
jgi:CheY-like chemotaxis protein